MSQEEIADNWEALEDSGELDKRLPTVAPQPKENSNMPGHRLQEDGCRSTFQPQIRILKRRPDTANESGDTQQKQVQQKPVKTLQQREAEYAEARLRILGSAAAPATNSTETSVNKEEQKSEEIVQQLQQVRMTDNILRMPLGPPSDGIKGFTAVREAKR